MQAVSTSVMIQPWQQSCVVGEALVDSLPFFGQSRSALRELLKARDCLQQPLSHSVSEAQAFVQAREDDKKKQQAKKDKSKSNTPASLLEACPGAEPGGESTKSAFWLYSEVSRSGCWNDALSDISPRVDHAGILQRPHKGGFACFTARF